MSHPLGVDSILSALLTLIWLALSWYGAGIFGEKETNGVANRLRDAIFVVVVSAFALALLRLFYPLACFGVSAAIAALRWYSDRRIPRRRPQDNFVFAHVLPVTAVVAVTWPGIVRPLLDGDSLSYHLPNAASWAHSHSLWTTTTAYWWYPPGSELFASSLFLIGGPKVLWLAGAAALLLLALRTEAFARRAGLSVGSAGAVAAMVVTVPMIGLQGASLQNDVWLGAWTLECLWAFMYDRSALARSAAVCSIIKPVGFIFAAIVVLFGLFETKVRLRAPSRIWLIAFGACSILAIWALHVMILWPHATISPLQASYPHAASTSILAHGANGISVLANAVVTQGVGTVVLFATVPAALFLGKTRLLQHLPWIYFVIFLTEPFGFNNGIPQLATGSSLRYSIPAIVVGIVGILHVAARWPTFTGIAAALIATVQTNRIIDIFWNDANTHGVVLVALAIGGLYCLKSKISTPAAAVLISAICIYGIHLDADPARYYDASLGSNATPAGVFAWLAQNRPQRIVVSHLNGGLFSVVVPEAFVADSNRNSCNEAAALKAVVVADGSPYRNCGRTLFADAYSTVYEAGTAMSVQGR